MFTFLNNIYTKIGAKGVALNVLVAFTITVMIFGIIVAIGRIIDEIEQFMIVKITNAFGAKTATIICNYLTFPGVILHELAHCFMVIAFGGKVTKCQLFTLTGRGRLGYVEYVTRGSRIKQSLQLMFGSSAPTICGIFNLYLIHRIFELNKLSVLNTVLLIYIAFSIAVHMSMSDADMKSYLKGVIYAFPVVFGLTFLIQYFVVRQL